MYKILLSGELKQYYEIDPKNSWMLAAAEKNLTVLFGYRFKKVYKDAKLNKLTGAEFVHVKSGNKLMIKARVVVDGTELADVLANAGEAYDLGMDDPKESGEKEAREKNNIIQT